jgi:hypothetical protein
LLELPFVRVKAFKAIVYLKFELHRNAKPDIVVSNLAGNQVTVFMKQYLNSACLTPVVGFAFDTAMAWGAGKGNVLGTWPLVWSHQVQTPSAKTFTDAFTKKYGRPVRGQKLAWPVVRHRLCNADQRCHD